VSLHRRSPRALTEALEPLQAAWGPETLLAEVQRVWPSAVGEAIAAEAMPQAARGGVLTIACSASVWAHELDLMGPAIIARLNDILTLGQVVRLRCITAP